MKIATDQNWKQYEDSEVALVMFSSPWAGACNLARPGFEEAASRFGNQIEFAEFCIDDNPNTPERYGIKAVPFFLMMEKGVPQAAFAGAVPPETIIEYCEAVL